MNGHFVIEEVLGVPCPYVVTILFKDIEHLQIKIQKF